MATLPKPGEQYTINIVMTAELNMSKRLSISVFHPLNFQLAVPNYAEKTKNGSAALSPFGCKRLRKFQQH